MPVFQFHCITHSSTSSDLFTNPSQTDSCAARKDDLSWSVKRLLNVVNLPQHEKNSHAPFRRTPNSRMGGSFFFYLLSCQTALMRKHPAS